LKVGDSADYGVWVDSRRRAAKGESFTGQVTC